MIAQSVFKNSYRLKRAGHPYTLKTIREKLFCLLARYKLYPTFWLLELLVRLDTANAYKLVEKLRPLLAKAADPELNKTLTQQNKKKINSLEQLKEEYPQVYEILIDATEKTQNCLLGSGYRKYKRKRRQIRRKRTINGKIEKF